VAGTADPLLERDRDGIAWPAPTRERQVGGRGPIELPERAHVGRSESLGLTANPTDQLIELRPRWASFALKSV
jgi:hypothetical protein